MSIASSGLNKKVGFDGLNDFHEMKKSTIRADNFRSHLECQKSSKADAF